MLLVIGIVRADLDYSPLLLGALRPALGRRDQIGGQTNARRHRTRTFIHHQFSRRAIARAHSDEACPDLKKHVEPDMTSTAAVPDQLDPMASVQKELDAAMSDKARRTPPAASGTPAG